MFPYDNITDWTKPDETNLPSNDDFYLKLKNGGISGADCGHARNVWDAFEISNLGEYMDLYLKTDMLLLADIFENFKSANGLRTA